MSAPPRAPYDPRQGDPTSTNPWLRWLIVGCGALLFAFVLVGVGIFAVVGRATAGPEKAVKGFLAAAGARDYAAAHEHFSEALKQAQPLEELAAIAEANRHLFEVEDTTFNERSVDLAGAQLAGRVTLAAGSDIPASFRLVKEAGEWKLIGYNLGE
jgi:hypothetical protein